MPIRRTLAGPIQLEIDKIRGSRFIGHASHAATRDEAGQFLDEVRRLHPDARHHCFAWRLDTDDTRAHDAGEPGGSAGNPILAQIVGAELFHTVVVVVRHFGGTKLGVGGLIRAYGGCARETLAAAEITERPEVAGVRLTYDYNLSSSMDRVFAAHDGRDVRCEYGERVCRIVEVPVEQFDEFYAALIEAGRGQATIEPTA